MTIILRDSGIRDIGLFRWGTHICNFYRTKNELLDILIPYFRSGLINNEFCIWLTSNPLSPEEAEAALRKALKNLDSYFKKGQLEILDAGYFYTKSGRFDQQKVLQTWLEKSNLAFHRGFEGVRSTGNTSWLNKNDWEKFIDYEAKANTSIVGQPALALCTYSLEQWGLTEIIDVVNSHHFTLLKDQKQDRYELRGNMQFQRFEEEKKLEASEREIKKFSHKILSIREEEKKALAAVLHNETGALSVALSSSLASIEQEIKKKNLKSALKAMAKYKNTLFKELKRIKRIAANLRPPDLEFSGLPCALKTYFSSLTQKARINIDFQTNLAQKDVDEKTAIVIFRIAQEAFNNIIAHSRAKQVKVRLFSHNQRIEFIIQDDGKGFEVEKYMKDTRHKKKMGIRIMNELAESLEGILCVRSAPEKGTEILASLPCPE